MIARRILVLVLVALAWALAFIAVRMLTSLGDCFDEHCRNGRALTETITGGVLVLSYLTIAWFVIRSRKLS